MRRKLCIVPSKAHDLMRAPSAEVVFAKIVPSLGRRPVEIELARLVIHSLLVQYLSFSSTLMLSSMHHIDTHIF